MAELMTAAVNPEYLDALERIDRAEGEDQASAVRDGRTLTIRTDDEIEHLPPLEWLAEGILPANALAAIYGAPGAGKSFVALDLALSIAAPAPWFDRDLLDGTSLYIAAEGLSGLPKRIRAWKIARRQERPLGVGFVTTAIDLMQPATVLRAVDAARRLNAPVQLVVIDTLARSMIGDENDTGEMSKVVAHADAIRRGTGATVLLVHHTRKDSDLERGSSALRGAVDTLLLCREGDDGRELVCEKQKDGEQFAPLPFRLVAGHGSCIVQASGSGSAEDAREQAEPMTKPRRAALCALAEAFTGRGATATEWFKATGVPERTFFRARTWLVKNGYATEGSNRYTLTPSGKQASTVSCHGPAIVPAKPLGRPLAAAALASSGGVPAGDHLASGNGRQNGNRYQQEEIDDLLADIDERIGQRDDE